MYKFEFYTLYVACYIREPKYVYIYIYISKWINIVVHVFSKNKCKRTGNLKTCVL